MYVVTFYSFKGGVGRSQALMNVAIEMALRGRRVLVVDFDLEAPGLHSYRPFSRKKKQNGMVEYVNQYLETAEAPDVSDFIIQSENFRGDHKIWLMPSGRLDSSYATRLSKIDWNNLYSRNYGYLFFEDLKQQWRDVIDPDYVLIDSRTGHTDVGGICTRQLPDAVVAMMLPNHQNITGMQQVISDIRVENDIRIENELNHDRQIKLHFVFSNVPNIDDEDEVLVKLTNKAEKLLGCSSETVRIHNYPSLNLLDQAIFTLDRPKTSLSREYRDLVSAIQRLNPEDRDGALNWLTVVGRETRLQWADEDETRFERVLERHDNDGAILSAAANVRARLGDFKAARSLFAAALELGSRDPEVLNRYAQVLIILKQPSEAVNIFKQILDSEQSSPQQVMRAVRGISELFTPKEQQQASVISRLTESKAILALSQSYKIKVSSILLSNGHPKVAKELINNIQTDKSIEELDFDPTDDLVLAMIGCGEWKKAIEILNTYGHPDISIRDSFNLAMAMWGQDKTPNLQKFKEVIRLHEMREEGKGSPTANYYQCIAIAYTVLSDRNNAIDNLEEALRHAKKSKNEIFSALRYKFVTPAKFIEDVDVIRRIAESDDNQIPVFADSK